MSNVLTYLTQAQISASVASLNGKTLSRPALLTTDGVAVVYVVDVDIGQTSILRNVPVARNNRELTFADSGTAVELQRDASGQWEVVGLSDEMPGTYTSFTVDLGTFAFGAVTDLGLVSRPLTYAELATHGGYGNVPYGAIGVFQGGVLLELTS